MRDLLIVSHRFPTRGWKKKEIGGRKSLNQINHETSYVLCPPGPWGCTDACAAQSPGYTMTVEATAASVAENGTVYRFYVNAQNETDKISAVFGNDQDT